MLGDFRAVFLPYCLDKQSDGTYVVLNREYKPVGFKTREWVKYPGAPALDKRDRTSKSLSRSRARRVDLLRRPRSPCGPANTAGPQWLDASRGSATADYAPSLRSPWRAAEEYPIRVKIKGLTEAKVAKLSYNGSKDMDRIYLYEDASNPIRSKKNMDAYLAKLAMLAKLQVV